MSRTRVRVRWGRVTALLASAVLLVGAAGRAAGAVAAHRERPAARTYVVKPGDTLWSIASRAAGRSADPRPLVDAIAGLNGVSGPLLAGETIRIPQS
jgi:Tfp pilus assembly protein FimV